jgi:hypothetical protein
MWRKGGHGIEGPTPNAAAPRDAIADLRSSPGLVNADRLTRGVGARPSRTRRRIESQPEKPLPLPAWSHFLPWSD